MGKKQNNMKRKKLGGGRGSCLGGLRSFSESGRANKRARKIARNIARDQGRQMTKMNESLQLEAALGDSIDWSKSGMSIRQRKKLKRYRKAHKFQAPTTQEEADTAASSAATDGSSSISDASMAALTTASCWQGTIPTIEDLPSTELKLLRKTLGIRVNGRPCPPPIELINDVRLPKDSFSELWKYDDPTPVQRQLWPAALCGLDCMAVAPTGSGKTLAYILPAVAHIRRAKKDERENGVGDVRGGDGRASAPRGMFCVPTRELATQVVEVCTKRLRLIKKANVRAMALVGGRGTKESQVDELLRGAAVDIVVGTCGRLLDLIDLGALSMVRVTVLVLDEADMMLQMGFEEQLQRLFEMAPSRRQTILVSATFPQALRDAKSRWTRGDLFTTTIRVGTAVLLKDQRTNANNVVVGQGEGLKEKSRGESVVVSTLLGVGDGHTSYTNMMSGATIPHGRDAAQSATVSSSTSSTLISSTSSTSSISSSSSSSSSSTSTSSTSLAASMTIIQTVHVLHGTAGSNYGSNKYGKLNDTQLLREKTKHMSLFISKVAAHDKARGSRHKSAILLFANTRDTVEHIYEHLRLTSLNTTREKGKHSKSDFGVGMLHGQLPQSMRAQALADFRAGKSSILVTTDVAARGLDIEKLPFVFNFDMPRSIEMYVHRIGRTGRRGNVGVAETLFSWDQDNKMSKQLIKVLKDCNQQVPSELLE